MKPILLMCNVVVLAEDASEVAAGEEDAAASIVALKTRLFTKMRRHRVHDYIGSYQAGPSSLESVDSAKSRAEVAVA